MIHYWECDRCTHEWTSCCFGDIGLSDEEKKRRHRQLTSGLCWDCFKKLESGEIKGLELFELYAYLDTKSDRYGASTTWKVFNEGTEEKPWYNHQKFSGMCHEIILPTFNEDGSYNDKGNFESGFTNEHKQLQKLVSEMRDVYRSVILEQRTPKRIELAEFHKTSGFVFFGPQPRPEGFVGDEAGEDRPTLLFGVDFHSGVFVAPTIVMQNGTNGPDTQN